MPTVAVHLGSGDDIVVEGDSGEALEVRRAGRVDWRVDGRVDTLAGSTAASLEER